ncbi:MAG TPA: HAMP domain-containing sensor histidine kinase [Oligoflexus sp.]|uniref:sensor histidine kinase n=1 Tax=Oligoflexus sp. TaxID=1971216 RepID=UPI002D2ABF10|nr:HAMP domain-containing sensor histidine kinase [Oligoflexus sp.]HYX31645.1 HAMP domain-containing sensor histidine kinase [Oligoflexus sp.]
MPDVPGLLLKFRNFADSILSRKKKPQDLRCSCRKIAKSLGLESLDTMVGGVSHEVNNPLAIAMGLLIQYERLAQSDPTPADFMLLQNKLDQALQRIRYVVDGLKSFSQGQLDEAIQEKNIGSLCRQLLILNQNRLQGSRVSVQIIDATYNMCIQCRPHQLLRTLQGLLDNALEATAHQDQPDVTIKIFREDTRVVLQVIDNGHGIPVHLRPRIFEPFFSTKSFKVGQGLTLATAKGLIEAQGGQMSYESPTIGSCFTIRMPCDLEFPGDAHVSLFAPIYRSISLWKKAKKTTAALG